MTTAASAAPLARGEKTALVLLTLSQVGLFLIPLIVLGQAIGWPASLRLPAGKRCPLSLRKPWPCRSATGDTCSPPSP